MESPQKYFKKLNEYKDFKNFYIHHQRISHIPTTFLHYAKSKFTTLGLCPNFGLTSFSGFITGKVIQPFYLNYKRLNQLRQLSSLEFYQH